jgi:colanic acid/amylovoran biosynthesis protein
MNIVIINQPLCNRGDEAAHRSLMRTLDKNFTDVNFTVLFFQEKENDINEFVVKSSRITYTNIKGFGRGIHFLQKWTLRFNLIFLSLLHPTIRKYAHRIKQADIVICAMGGINMGGFQDWVHIFNLSLVKFYKKKLVYYSRSFGPFPTETTGNRVFKKISLKLLNYFDFLSFRDKKSMELADKLHLEYVPSIDTAFLDTPEAIIPKEISDLIGDEKYVIFVPNSLTWHRTYKKRNQDDIDSFFIEILKTLLLQNKKVIMLPQLSKAVSYSEPDYGYFLKLKNIVRNDNMIVIKDNYSSDIQQKIIANAECVIGARYHSIVFAINNTVPFISLSYEHKMTGLLNILNLNDREVDIAEVGTEKFNADIAINKLLAILDTKYSNEIAIKEKANNIAEETFTKLKNFIIKIWIIKKQE